MSGFCGLWRLKTELWMAAAWLVGIAAALAALFLVFGALPC